jgi:hypothetical protein
MSVGSRAAAGGGDYRIIPKFVFRRWRRQGREERAAGCSAGTMDVSSAMGVSFSVIIREVEVPSHILRRVRPCAQR